MTEEERFYARKLADALEKTPHVIPGRLSELIPNCFYLGNHSGRSCSITLGCKGLILGPNGVRLLSFPLLSSGNFYGTPEEAWYYPRPKHGAHRGRWHPFPPIAEAPLSR